MVFPKINVEMVNTEGENGAEMKGKVRISTISYTMMLRLKSAGGGQCFQTEMRSICVKENSEK